MTLIETAETRESLARVEIRDLLGGGSPNSHPLEAFGPWRDVIDALRQAYEGGGTAAVRKVWTALVNDNPGLARLVSDEPSFSHGTTPAALAREGNGWLSLGVVLEALGRGEVGDAELFAKLYAGRVVYDHGEGVWYLWGGQHWEADDRGQVGNLVNEVASQYHYGAAEKRRAGGDDSDTDQTVKALTERARKLRYRNKIGNVLSLARMQPGLALSGREWDSAPWLLGVSNGVIDLHDGSFRPGLPSDRIRIAAPTRWEGIDAPAPRWGQFLTEIYNNDREIVDFKQRLLGYGISGLNKEHVLPVLWGAGRNGKDTLLDAISHVLGDLALPVSSEVVLSGYRPPNSATPHLYALRPLRLAWVSESEEGARLNTGQIKFLTGGGLVTARPLYGKPITFKPQYLLFLVTNHRPHASGSDYGLWKRLLLIPFKQAFVDDPDPQRENEHLRDKDLGEKLKAEAPGILAWLVRGFLAWQGQGLNPPEAITRATTAYKTEEDVIAQFLEEKCVILPGAKIKASAFYLAYKTWAREYGWRLMKGAAFGRRVNELFERRRRSDGFWYLGIGLTSSDEDQSIAQMEF